MRSLFSIRNGFSFQVEILQSIRKFCEFVKEKMDDQEKSYKISCCVEIIPSSKLHTTTLSYSTQRGSKDETCPFVS